MNDDEKREHRAAPEEPMAMPRWVPIAVGLVLVALAGAAVFTGLRYRNNALTAIARPRTSTVARTSGGGPPGEPGPGASLVLPGDGGDNAPHANAPVTGKSRVEITTGTNGAVQSTVRLWARRAMIVHVTPDTAVLSVNDLPVGSAAQFNKAETAFEFAAPGSYTVHITAPGYRDQQFVVTCAADAPQEIAVVNAVLAKE